MISKTPPPLEYNIVEDNQILSIQNYNIEVMNILRNNQNPASHIIIISHTSGKIQILCNPLRVKMKRALNNVKCCIFYKRPP